MGVECHCDKSARELPPYRVCDSFGMTVQGEAPLVAVLAQPPQSLRRSAQTRRRAAAFVPFDVCRLYNRSLRSDSAGGRLCAAGAKHMQKSVQDNAQR